MILSTGVGVGLIVSCVGAGVGGAGRPGYPRFSSRLVPPSLPLPVFGLLFSTHALVSLRLGQGLWFDFRLDVWSLDSCQ